MSDLCTPDDVVQEFQLPSKATLYQWRYKGEGPPAIKIGRHLRYRREDLDAWLAAQADPTLPQHPRSAA